MNILVVDDEQMQRTMLQGFLEKQGYRVVAAACAEGALRLFMKQPIELALLDHRMPDLNGDELLARLKDVNPMLNVIMITAFGNVDNAVRVMQLGADDFLEKPVDLSVLLDKIRHLEEKAFVDRDAVEVENVMDTDTLPVRMWPGVLS